MLQLNTHCHLTTCPPSPPSTYSMPIDCNKADEHLPTRRKWTHFTEDTESAFTQPNIHTANIIFTKIILMADKHNIPKGKMHSNCIVCKITQSNNMRSAITCDLALKLLNEESTSDIHNQHLWKEHLDYICTLGSQAQHTHSLEDHT